MGLYGPVHTQQQCLRYAVLTVGEAILDKQSSFESHSSGGRSPKEVFEWLQNLIKSKP